MSPMKVGGILFLAANTPRSQAYAQAFAARGIDLAHVILFDRPGAAQPGKADLPNRPDKTTAVPLPDPHIPLTQSLNALTDRVERIEAESVNDPAILAAVRSAAADLVIYSGYGGQLVSAELLSLGPPFLHAHSGWLPDYRGSTTIYYSLVAGEGCGVSVIEMVPAIDQGPIVARQRYPAPPVGVDIDYFYDSAIRADLMAEVAAQWQKQGHLEHVETGGVSADYYVVHPLLKHLALLGLKDDRADAAGESDAD
ncbi:MAG: formyltransferase family protein [Proteobacteria bacterium]|nr:formyltransferase family protein [Pseudomonadota bacterium]